MLLFELPYKRENIMQGSVRAVFFLFDLFCFCKGTCLGFKTVPLVFENFVLWNLILG
ncbi:MAG: hypothetical protein ACI9AU_001287 [Bacteroidia bacterium]|jgi:hypothetical protein